MQHIQTEHTEGGMKYKINDIYPTIQGEGCLTGMPMILVRLQGCGVGCPWCDTKETWDEIQGEVGSFDEAKGKSRKWNYMEPGEIVDSFAEVAPQAETQWVMVTGGEPMEQDLGELIATFRRRGFRVAVETSGTEPINAQPDWLTISPKIGMAKPFRPATVRTADEIKFPVGSQKDINTLVRLVGCEEHTAHVCIEPLSQS